MWPRNDRVPLAVPVRDLRALAIRPPLRREEATQNEMNRYPPKRIGLKERRRVLELANEGLSIRQIAERVGISFATAKKVLAQGLRHCARCGRLTDRGDLCPVCSLPVDAPFHDRLKAIRMVADISQMSLALRIGVHEHRVLNWEKGRTQPTEREIKMLAEGLGLTVHELTGNAESQKGG
jgi:DNA-binding XRE family transcriptional regulator